MSVSNQAYTDAMQCVRDIEAELNPHRVAMDATEQERRSRSITPEREAELKAQYKALEPLETQWSREQRKKLEAARKDVATATEAYHAAQDKAHEEAQAKAAAAVQEAEARQAAATAQTTAQANAPQVAPAQASQEQGAEAPSTLATPTPPLDPEHQPIMLTTLAEGRSDAPATPAQLKMMAEAMARERAGEIEASLAEKRFQRFMQQGPQIVRVDVEGDPEPWFIQRVNLERMAMFTMLCSRDEQGQLTWQQQNVFGSLLAAELFVCVVRGANDPTPFFEDFQEACAIANSTEPAVMAISSDLHAAIIKFNPEVLDPFNTKGKSRKNQGTSEDDAAPLAVTTAPLSAKPSSVPASGSAATPHTAAPS